MPFVRSSSEDDNEDAATSVPAGAAPFPGDPDEVDWNDPELVKVHYDVSAWDFEQRAELAETLAERNVPHRWENDELVVPEAAEAFTDVMFDELEAELGPFPVALGGDDAGTEFGLDEWPPDDIESLRTALIEAAIAHRWEGRTLVVATESEDTVDDLLDAIESGEVATLDESAPDGALHTLYSIADELARDPSDGPARGRLLDLAPQLSPSAPPYGLALRAWAVIVAKADAVAELFAAGGDPDAVAAAADELRAVCRPYV
jgi:hypothetical protein